ncbi:Rieske 2Fe-2S domain-containing protein [Gordonia sp. HNM0687]|uniref:Cytochrome bc1 complex Rieske iron-sulfur subunit n=1 Tax=Gordonia mangrovi TaxID=2665643 RepID=A0A6L7GWF2_9ACTN|nr:Rieske (2Fe-2S) protein [Gordonia mangrovi]MXP22955.1 Rieske 2Fe-2S domain-containing protein [Gordonia mangrovi]UVF77253.1 Rieske (2Fe-2S) protein [Gordonia mangrovi]
MSNANIPTGIGRRKVLGGAAAAVAGAAALAACGSDDSSESSTTASAAESSGDGGVLPDAASIAVGGGVVMDLVKTVVTHPADGEYKAFSAVCTHKGCTVSDVTDNEIICPCHNSKFSASDGSVIEGPATEPLASRPVSVADGKITLG